MSVRPRAHPLGFLCDDLKRLGIVTCEDAMNAPEGKNGSRPPVSFWCASGGA
jgi:hypothetical protein